MINKYSMNRDKIIENLKSYTSSKDKIVFAYLFGSLARGESGGNSDIDLGMYLIPDCQENFFALKLEYKNELEQILKKPVDIVIMNDAPPLLNHQIFRDGILLKNQDQKILTNFRVRNFHFYQDQKTIMGMYLEATKKKIKEALHNGR